MLHNVTFRRLLQLKAGKHILEDSMSSRPEPRISLAPLSGLFLMFALILVSSLVVAQSDSNPKWVLFVGYQWLHPGGTVPAAFGDPAAPTPSKIPDMDK